MQAKIKLDLASYNTCNPCMPARASEQRDAIEAKGSYFRRVGPKESHWNGLQREQRSNNLPREVKTDFLNTNSHNAIGAALLVGAPVPVQEPRDGLRVGGRVRRGQRPVALGVRPALGSCEQSC